VESTATFVRAGITASAGVAVRTRVTAGGCASLGATRLPVSIPAAPLPASWRGIGHAAVAVAPAAGATVADGVRVAIATDVDVVPAGFPRLAMNNGTAKRQMNGKNGTQLRKGSPPWRFPV
jgi:hypothetical protein